MGLRRILVLKFFWVQKIWVNQIFGFKKLFRLYEACVLNLGLRLYTEPFKVCSGKEQTEPKFSAEIRPRAEIRFRLGRNRTPIYKFRFRLGRNRNLITNFGLNRIFRPKFLKERRRDQTWKKVLMCGIKPYQW